MNERLIDAGNEGARLGKDLYKPILLENPQSISYGCNAHIVALCQFASEQAGSRRKIKRQDALPQMIVDTR